MKCDWHLTAVGHSIKINRQNTFCDKIRMKKNTGFSSMSNRQYYHNNNVVQRDTSQLRSLYFLRETDGKKNQNSPKKNSGLF